MAVVEGQSVPGVTTQYVAGVGSRPGISLCPQRLLSSGCSRALLPLWVRAFSAGAQQLIPGGEARSC